MATVTLACPQEPKAAAIEDHFQHTPQFNLPSFLAFEIPNSPLFSVHFTTLHLCISCSLFQRFNVILVLVTESVCLIFYGSPGLMGDKLR